MEEASEMEQVNTPACQVAHVMMAERWQLVAEIADCNVMYSSRLLHGEGTSCASGWLWNAEAMGCHQHRWSTPNDAVPMLCTTNIAIF